MIILYRAHSWRSSNILSIRSSKSCPRTVSIKRSYLRRALRRCAQSGKSCENGIRSRCTETIRSRARDCGLVWGCSSRQWRKNKEQRNSKTRRRWYHRNRRKKAQAKHKRTNTKRAQQRGERDNKGNSSFSSSTSGHNRPPTARKKRFDHNARGSCCAQSVALAAFRVALSPMHPLEPAQEQAMRNVRSGEGQRTATANNSSSSKHLSSRPKWADRGDTTSSSNNNYIYDDNDDGSLSATTTTAATHSAARTERDSLDVQQVYLCEYACYPQLRHVRRQQMMYALHFILM